MLAGVQYFRSLVLQIFIIVRGYSYFLLIAKYIIPITDPIFTTFFFTILNVYMLFAIFINKECSKKLDGNYTRMLRAILNKSWWQHPTRHQLYGHLPPITKTIQVRQTRHAGHCWRSKDELISDVLLWTPADGQAKAG